MMIAVVFSVFSVNGQSTANYAFSTNATGSLTNMSSGTTQLVASLTDDSPASSLTNIGFDFFLMGTRYSQFSVNANGLMQLGASAGTTANVQIGSATGPQISAFSLDQETSASGKVHYKVTGAAPNRVLTVEWLNMQIGFGSGTVDGTYQVLLYETTGQIQFIYGSMVYNYAPSTTTVSAGFAVNTTNNNYATVNVNTNAVTTTGSTTNFNLGTTVPVTLQVNSAANGSRRIYNFIPNAAIVSPTALNFTAPTTTTMTLNWTAASPITNILKYAVYNSVDGGVTYNFVNTTNVGTNTLAVTGLIPGTSYLWKVYSINEGALSASPATGTQATTAAATYFYVGAATGDFTTAANWNTLANGTGSARSSAQTTDILIVDGAGTTAGSAVTIAMSAATSIGALQITNNTPVTLQSSTTTTRILTLTGSVGNELDVPAGSSLILNNATQAAQIIFANASGITGNIAGTLSFAGSASNTLTTDNGAGSLVTVQGTGIVNLGNSTISLIGTAATLSFAAGSNCNASGATTTAAPVPLATWATTSNLTISGLTTVTAAPTNNEQSFGNLTINCPASTAVMGFFVATTGAIVKGDYNVVATNTGRTRLLTTGTLTINGNFNATGGNFDLMNGAATLTILGNVNLSNGAKGNFANGAGTITIGGSVTVSNTATITVGNNATTHTTNIAGNLNLNSSGTSVLALTAATAINLNIDGNFNISNGTFNLSTGTGVGNLKVKGNFIQTGGTIGITGTSTTTNIEFNGTTAKNVTFTSAMTGLVNVRLNNAAGINLTGPLAINNGASYTVSSGSTTGSGTITYDATASKLVYNSTTGTQTANTKEFPASNGPVSLTINNTAVTPNNIVSAPFSRSLGTSGILTLTAGILDIGANSLTVPNTAAAAISGGSATTYLKGGVIIRNLPANLVTGSTYTFPVGKSTYNGFDLVNPTTNAGGPLTIQVEVFDANSGGTPGLLMSSLNTGRYWAASITAGSSNFTNSFIRLNDTRGTLDGIASSATLTGAYDHIGGATSTLATTSITTTAPAATTIPGFFIMGNLAGPTLNNLAITPSGNQCTNVTRSVTVTVTPGAAAVTTVTLNYTVNGVAQTGIGMTNTSGNNWSGTIPTVTPVNAIVTWSVTATDGNSILNTTNGVAYTDVPNFAVTATASATSTSLCAGDPTTLSAVLTTPTYTLGTGASATTGSDGSWYIIHKSVYPLLRWL